MITTCIRGHTRRCLAIIALTGALVTMAGGVSAQTDAASKETVTGPSHLDEAEMWAAVEQSVESMCMCLGRRVMEEEMTFEEMSRSPEKLQTWSMEAFSGGRCRPTGILARMLGLQQESSGDESTEQGSPQSKSLWSEIELAAMTAGCVQSIMLPAKHDYMIHAQVTEGLNLSAALKASVEEEFADSGLWPANLAALGITNPPSGRYVANIILTTGTISITYGNEADATLVLTPLLTIKPWVSANLDVVWACGNSGQPAGTTEAPTGNSATIATTVLNKDMPSACRR